MALGASADAAASERYVRANFALVTAGRAKLASQEAALNELLAHVRRECPLVLAGSPQNESSEKLTWQLIATMRIVAFHRVAGPIGAFARQVRNLRWSDAKLTRTVHTYASRLNAEATTTPPDFCADLRAWATSGYTKLPSDTLAFINVSFPVEAIGMLPASLHTAHASSAQQGLVRRSARLESQLVDGEARAVETWGAIMDAVELKQ